MSTVFHFIFFDPLYNLLVWLSGVLPYHSFGLAVIVVTLIVKLILLPLSHRATATQKAVKGLEGEIAALKEQHKNNREEQARQIMALYRSRGVNPLASLWIVLIQIPVVLALFWIFRQGLTVNHDLLYSFVIPPTSVNPNLFIFNLAERSYILALLTGITQWLQIRFSLPPPIPTSGPSFKNDFAKTMHFQMRYVLPVFVVIAASSLPSAVAVYWVTSNLFAIGQEWLMRRRATNQPANQSANPANRLSS